MIKPKKLKFGDKVAIVSLSRGFLGEDFEKHILELGVKQLKSFGLIPVFMDNALKGQKYLKAHPEIRAKDLKQAFSDPEIKAVISAIGGNDTTLTIPYLLDDVEFINNVKNNPKIFLGFSDSTNNHLMFYKLGLNTFYGQAFLTDLGEMSQEMLPYSKNAFKTLMQNNQTTLIKSSEFWYEERTSFSDEQLGVNLIAHKDNYGYEVLRGRGKINGTLFGGCMDSIYLALTGNDEFSGVKREKEMHQIFCKFNLFPDLKNLEDKIIFLEPSEELKDVNFFRTIIQEFELRGFFKMAKAIIIGKPINEINYQEYKQILIEETRNSKIPILYNLNFGHANPRAIIPYGLNAEIDFDKREFRIMETYFNENN